MIAAIALGAVALFVVARMFLGSSSRPTQTSGARVVPTPKLSNAPPSPSTPDQSAPDESLVLLRPVVWDGRASLDAPSAVGRNIFAYYVPPPPPPKKSPSALEAPPPTPEPTPPLSLVSLAPSNVYARTGDFTLNLSGDKFTPETRVFIDGREMPTRFLSPQQLSASVPASLISAPGGRQVLVRTPDGQLYSNPATLNVAQPPAPTYTFVGVLVRPRGNDTAILKDQKNELVNVQRGDLLGGRFRVTSISARSIEFTDQQLNIKHSLPFTEARPSTGNQPSFSQQPQPPAPRTDDEGKNSDEEP